MKIIAADNYARETVSDILIAENIANAEYAQVMCDALNAKFGGDYALRFYRVQPDEYVLYVFDPT